MVKVSYPLKQGLKLLSNFFGLLNLESRVKVSYPLKQGLKRIVVMFVKKLFFRRLK